MAQLCPIWHPADFHRSHLDLPLSYKRLAHDSSLSLKAHVAVHKKHRANLPCIHHIPQLFAYSFIFSIRDIEADSRASLYLPMQSPSGHSVIVTNSISNAETFLYQGHLPLDEARIKSSVLDIPPYAHSRQVTGNTEASSPANCGKPALVSTNMEPQAYLHPQTSSNLTQDINEGSGMSYPEHLIIDNREDFLVPHPSDSMCQKTFPWLTLPIAPRLEGFGLPPVIFDDRPRYIHRINANGTRNQSQRGVSIILSDQSHQYQYIPVDIPSNFSVSSVLPEVPDVPIVVKDKEQNLSRDKPQSLQKMGEGSVAVSLPSPRQPVGTRGTLKRYSCNICGKRYAQSQGVRRHQRETHRANLCTYCYAFEWGRPYRFKEHLEKEHPNVDLNVALGGATA
ncbi:hypothetical protein BC826DRAFT_188089 [Russula brevipes]|nr:hypothetical protein BC826DRAFT_188089 [Russula brevipes]